MSKGFRQQDRRVEQRYRVMDQAIAVLKSHPPTLGKIIDISNKGLSFRYVHNQERLIHATELDIFLVGHRFCLKGAIFNIVSKNMIAKNVRRLGVQFDRLSRRQIQQLENFIASYTIYKY